MFPLLSALLGCLVCNLGFLFIQILRVNGSAFIQQPQRADCPIFSHSFPPCQCLYCVCGEVQGCFYPGTVDPIPTRGKTPLRRGSPLSPRWTWAPWDQACHHKPWEEEPHTSCSIVGAGGRGSPPPKNQIRCWSGCHCGFASLLFKMPSLTAESPLSLTSWSLSVSRFCVH